MQRRKSNYAFLIHCNDFVFEFSAVKVIKCQFLVKLAFAAIFDKSQGLKLKEVGIDFQTTFFLPVQVYVLLSRVRETGDVLQIQKEEDDTSGWIIYYPITVVVKTPYYEKQLVLLK